MKEMTDLLNIELSNWTVLYTKLHNFHWFVKGPEFFTLHAKFEELFNIAATNIDEIAERILMLGGKPVATLKEVLSTTLIEEASENVSSNEMVATTIADFNKILEQIKIGLKIASDNDDDTTIDLLTGLKVSLEKEVWLLSSYLG